MNNLTQKINYLINEIGFLPVWEDDVEWIDFYYTCMHDYGFSLYDTDEYVNLNQILGYDIGAKAAQKISDYYYVNENISVLELGTKDRDELVKILEIVERKEA